MDDKSKIQITTQQNGISQGRRDIHKRYLTGILLQMAATVWWLHLTTVVITPAILLHILSELSRIPPRLPQYTVKNIRLSGGEFAKGFHFNGTGSV